MQKIHEQRLDSFGQLQVIPQSPKKGTYYFSDQGILLLGQRWGEEQGHTSFFPISLRGTTFNLYHWLMTINQS